MKTDVEHRKKSRTIAAWVTALAAFGLVQVTGLARFLIAPSPKGPVEVLELVLVGVVVLLYGMACVSMTKRSSQTAVPVFTALLVVSLASFVLFMAHGGVGVGFFGVLIPGWMLYAVRKPPLRDWLSESGT
jgi:hypothetical protein